MTNVDWVRMARPQDDGYDTETALAFARDEQKWLRPKIINPPALFDGRVGIRVWPFGALDVSTLVPGPIDHPNLLRAEGLLKDLWPDAWRQFSRIVIGIYPLRDTAHEPDGNHIGSASGHPMQQPFTVYLTYFDAFGTAEAMVHELAHIKLRCLGVHMESATRMILNDPSERFVSPLRDHRRPMTAVVHALYSWLHLTELDLRLVDKDRVRATQVLSRNLSWIQQMRDEIRGHSRCDAAGEAFLRGVFAWADDLLGRGQVVADTF